MGAELISLLKKKIIKVGPAFCKKVSIAKRTTHDISFLLTQADKGIKWIREDVVREKLKVITKQEKL